MNPIPFARSEDIGNPELFCGRKEELKALLDWVSLIPKEQAKSRALMATKKMGKTAILERLFNILFLNAMKDQDGIAPTSSVIPFFLRVEEIKISQKNFAAHFYCTFLTQYLAFKCKKPEWTNGLFPFPKLKKIAQEYELSEISENLEEYEWLVQERVHSENGTGWHLSQMG